MKRAVMLVLVGLASHAVADYGTGLGAVVGEPTGVSAKMWLGSTMAADPAAAWSVSGHASLPIRQA